MAISVIIPTLNEETTLALTLAHTSTLDVAEIVVVDGGSTDRTQAIVRSLAGNRQWAIGNERETEALPIHPAYSPSPIAPRLALLASPPGRACQMNRGAKASQTDVLLFLHTDTRLPSTAKQDIEAAMQNSQVVGGRFDVGFDRQTPLSTIISTMMNLRSRWSGIATGDQAIFVRRTIFEQLGGYAEIPLMEDIDFSRRLKRMGQTAPLRSRVVTSYRRWETHGPIRTILLMWALRFLYWTGVSPQRLAHLYTMVR